VGKGIFDIDIFKLANGKHSFEFDINDSYFELFEDSVIKKGGGTVKVELDRTPALLTFTFSIDCKVELVCDRSLDKFYYPVKESNCLRIKYGDHWEELSEELLMVPANTQKIDVGQFVYEFIILALPMKKLHPRFQGKDAEELVFSSADDEKSSSNDDIDPRWNDLKKLKETNNGTS